MVSKDCFVFGRTPHRVCRTCKADRSVAPTARGRRSRYGNDVGTVTRASAPSSGSCPGKWRSVPGRSRTGRPDASFFRDRGRSAPSCRGPVVRSILAEKPGGRKRIYRFEEAWGGGSGFIASWKKQYPSTPGFLNRGPVAAQGGHRVFLEGRSRADLCSWPCLF